eukprot:1557185-Prymnesium_polylepis.1
MAGGQLSPPREMVAALNGPRARPRGAALHQGVDGRQRAPGPGADRHLRRDRRRAAALRQVPQ